MGTRYYMLVSSLPHLPHFLRADRLPINPQRLLWRRACLTERDAADLKLALDLLHWPRHKAAELDAQVDAQYRHAMSHIHDVALRGFVDDTMGQRSVLAALRRKARQMPAPSAEERCGVGRWELILRDRWEREDFGLSSLFPWLSRAKAFLAEGQALELEKLQMEVTWAGASRIADADPFGFQAVFAYVFKWDVLSRWLSHNAGKAAERFTKLVEEVIHEQQPDAHAHANA